MIFKIIPKSRIPKKINLKKLCIRRITNYYDSFSGLSSVYLNTVDHLNLKLLFYSHTASFKIGISKVQGFENFGTFTIAPSIRSLHLDLIAFEHPQHLLRQLGKKIFTIMRSNIIMFIWTYEYLLCVTIVVSKCYSVSLSVLFSFIHFGENISVFSFIFCSILCKAMAITKDHLAQAINH